MGGKVPRRHNPTMELPTRPNLPPPFTIHLGKPRPGPIAPSTRAPPPASQESWDSLALASGAGSGGPGPETSVSGGRENRWVRAGVEHLAQRAMLLNGDREAPGALDGYRADGVLEPAGAVLRFPPVGAPGALGPVRSGSNGDQMIGPFKVTGVEFPAI